ncbi:DUF1499 domain-containing protein [Microbulbifer hydrolyticus]|uniref:DUF1499 domain-containing protein n=1 Tax=Microbulbifer hydrolyticus TaxID=48074 RepID=A0A6P1TDD5_9GAMM|nr:DUF1499 domain-containing protein [Microbulbifer hydrolyticus]MBB5212013.1 hypothetical protein [Microbulbifer hydrolyticus]QHQ39695.1 DUF1499 domain-containing protein [Microbulbifer hydrolyticus]
MIRSGRPRHWSRWLYRIQWLLLAAIGLGVVTVRTGLLDLDSVFVLFGALGLAMVAVALFSMLVFLWGLIRRHGEARTAALWAMVMGLVPVAIPLFTVGQHNLNAPALYDISTDLVDPPQFDLLLSLRDSGDHSPDYPGDAAASVQRAAPAYSDIQTLVLPAPAQEVLASAEAVARDLGWRVIAVKTGEGRLEAVAQTPILGITQDIVVRIRPENAAAGRESGKKPDKGGESKPGAKPGAAEAKGEAGTRVDMRSASRTGERDFGSNAARIREFMRQLQDRTKVAP